MRAQLGRGVIEHPRPARHLTDPELAEALAVASRREPVYETLREVIGVLARAMADRYEP